MAGERNHSNSETCLSDWYLNENSQENAENISSDEYFVRLHAVNTNGKNMLDSGDVCRTPENIDRSVTFENNSGFPKTKIECNENNDNIISENSVLNNFNEARNNDVGDTSSKLQTKDRIEKFDDNFFASRLNNCPSQRENKNKSYGTVDQTESFESPTKSIKYFKPTRIPKFYNIHRKGKNYCTEDNFTCDNMEANSHTHDTHVKIKSSKEEKMTKNGSKVNVFCDSTILKTPSKNTNEKSHIHSSKTSEMIMKDFKNENDLLSKKEVVKSSAEKNDSSISTNVVKTRELKRRIRSKSVTDLITYFESLSETKKSNVKSKTESFGSKQKLKNDCIIKVNRIINSNTSKPSPKLQISSYGPEKSNIEKRVSEDISEIDSGDGKRTAAEKPEVHLHNVNLGDRKRSFEAIQEKNIADVNLGDRTDENFSQHNEFDVSTGTRKKSIIVLDPSHYKLHNYENMESSMTKLETCAYCKGKCTLSEQAINHSKHYVNNVKEHVFLFPEGIPKQTKLPSISNPRRFRSRFTRKNKSMYLRSFNETSNSKKDGKKTSDVNKIETSILTDSVYETAVKISLNDKKTNELLLAQNSIEAQKPDRNLFDKKKSKLSFTSVKDPKKKCFIGILFAAIIFVTIYKGASDYNNFW